MNPCPCGTWVGSIHGLHQVEHHDCVWHDSPQCGVCLAGKDLIRDLEDMLFWAAGRSCDGRD